MHGEMAMSSGSHVLLSAGLMVQSIPDQRQIDSRFGRLTINPAQAIHFPTGLLGMPDKANFCLARFPSEKFARFSVLQSLDDEALAFITLPLDIDNPLIERADFAQASTDLHLPLSDVLPLLLVSVHRDSGVAKLSVNARAPVLIRASLKVGAQYVFPHTKYLIRQPLSL